MCETYNKYSSNEVCSILETYNFTSYLNSFNIPQNNLNIIIGQPNYFKSLSSHTELIPLTYWKSYIQAALLKKVGSHLSTNLEKINFSFYKTVLTGKSIDKITKHKAIDEITSLPISSILGEQFVEKYYSKKGFLTLTILVLFYYIIFLIFGKNEIKYFLIFLLFLIVI